MIFHVPLGQKLGEEKDFEETGCFSPGLYPVGQLICDPTQKFLLQSCTGPENFSNISSSIKSYSTFSSRHRDTQTLALPSIYKQAKILNAFLIPFTSLYSLCSLCSWWINYFCSDKWSTLLCQSITKEQYFNTETCGQSYKTILA
jgi:hypothetical protein